MLTLTAALKLAHPPTHCPPPSQVMLLVLANFMYDCVHLAILMWFVHRYGIPAMVRGEMAIDDDHAAGKKAAGKTAAGEAAAA